MRKRGVERVQDPVPCEKPPSGAGRSRSMAPQRTRDGRDHRAGEVKRPQLASGPSTGRSTEIRTWSRTPSIKSGIGLFRRFTRVCDTGLSSTPQPKVSTRVRSIYLCSAVTGIFLICYRLDDFEVHRSTRFDAGNPNGDLDPMPILAGIALRTATQGAAPRNRRRSHQIQQATWHPPASGGGSIDDVQSVASEIRS